MLTLPFAAIAASKPLRSLENNGPHTFCLPLSDTPQVYCKCAIHWPYTSFCANMWQAMGPFQICGCPFHEPGVSEIVHMSYCHKCWPYIYIYMYIYIYILFVPTKDNDLPLLVGPVIGIKFGMGTLKYNQRFTPGIGLNHLKSIDPQKYG